MSCPRRPRVLPICVICCLVIAGLGQHLPPTALASPELTDVKALARHLACKSRIKQAVSRRAQYTAKVLPGAKQVGQANAAPSEGRKFRRRVAPQKRPRHLMPDAVERKLGSQFLKRLSLAPASRICGIRRIDSASPETSEELVVTFLFTQSQNRS